MLRLFIITCKLYQLHTSYLAVILAGIGSACNWVTHVQDDCFLKNLYFATSFKQN